MSETTILAIVTVSCTAGATVLAAMIQAVGSGIRLVFERKQAESQRKLDILEDYFQVVFSGHYSQVDADLCRTLGSVYLYIDRRQWPLIDSINDAILQGQRDLAIRLYSELLSHIRIPGRKLTSSSNSQG